MNYLIDTGFWIALYEPIKEPANFEEAETIADLIENENIVIPFPTMYEYLNSHFARRSFAHNFQKLLSRPNYYKIFDEKYRNQAYDEFFINAINFSKDVSLVDEVIKQMILDNSLKIDMLITFDESLKNFAIAHGIKTN